MKTCGRALLTGAWLLAALPLFPAGQDGLRTPGARHGRLDLAAHEFRKAGLVALDGEWEFYWNELLEPSAFRTAPTATEARRTGYFTIPRYWNGQRVNGTTLGGDGCATFRLTVRLPATFSNHQASFGMRLPDPATAYRLWIDGSPAAAAGVVDKDPRRMVPSLNTTREIYFRNQGRSLEIVLQIANARLVDGGPGAGFRFGSADAVAAARARDAGYNWFILGGLTLIIIYHFIMYFFRRRDASLLLFGLFSVVILLRFLLTGDRMLQSFLPGLPWELAVKLEYLSFYLVPAILYAFLHTLFGREYSARSVRLVLVVTLVFAVFVAIAPPKAFAASLVPFDLFTVLLTVYTIARLVTAVRNGREGALFLLVEFSFLAILALNDILHTLRMVDTGSFLAPGILLVTYTQAIYLSYRFSAALNAVENLSRNLEVKVAERTLELDEANQQLRRLDNLKNDFIANISHDFRSPLTVILSISDLALQYNRGLDAKIREDFHVINQASRRLQNSVDRLLDLARLEAQGLRPRITRVHLLAFMERILGYYRSALQNTGIRLSGLLPAREPADFFSDPEQLEAILDNILSNAVKFVPPASGVITVELRDGDETIVITVTDNGSGIPKEKQESIFNRFEQAHDNQGGRRRGTGIGLAYARQLAGHLQGQIRAVSDGAGRGSSFILEFRKGRDVFPPGGEA